MILLSMDLWIAGKIMTFEYLMVLLGLVALLFLYVVSVYNKLVGLRINKDEAWSDIQVQMKRRYNLIPNLVETVKGYATHENEALENVISARGAAVTASGSPKEQAGPENILTGALRQLLVVTEAYPELKADKGFHNLHKNLLELEDTIQKSRRYFNGNVREMNKVVQEFPSNIVAGVFKFDSNEFFELEDHEELAVKSAPMVEL